jgi:hypothetical protein
MARVLKSFGARQQAILDRHYLSRDVEMAESAIRKREAAEKISNRSSDRAA